MDEQQQQEVVNDSPKRAGLLRNLLDKGSQHPFFSNKVLLILLSGLTFLLPIFFIPSSLFSPEFSKTLLLEVVAIIGIVIWGVQRLRDGNFLLPKSFLLLVSLMILLVFVVSGIVSPTPMISFLGTAGEVGTVASIAVLTILMFLSSLVFRDRDRVLTLYASLVLSTLVLMFYHLIRHFAGPILSFGVFSSAVTTPAGKWNDLAAFAGVIILLVLTTLYYFSQNKSLKVPAAVLFVASLFILIMIDFTVLWIILFALSGIMMLYAIFEGEKKYKHARLEAGESHVHKPAHKRIVGHIPVYAVIIFLVSLVYGTQISAITFGANNLSLKGVVSKFIGAEPYSEVVLSQGYTYQIAKKTLAEQPFFGIGPNRFATAYLQHKTSEMNITPFWDSTFDYGTGRVTTFFTTTGILGALLWIVFVVLLLLKLRKLYPIVAKDRVSAYVGVSLFLLVIYFWSLSFFYLPNLAVFAMSFIFTGALIGFLVGEGAIGEYHAKWKGGPITNFVFTPFVVIVIVGALASSAMLYRQASALAAYNNARVAISNGNDNQAEININKAIALNDRDVYQRFLSALALLKLQQVAAAQAQDPQAALQQADKLVTQARTSAERAVALDPTNFENHISVGAVYDTLGALGIQGTSDSAKNGYLKALELNPRSPRILFLLARVELLAGNRSNAKGYLEKALAERPNFLEAISLLTQLEIQDKNVPSAINVIKNGVALEPTNFLLRFALGYLYYANQDFTNATIEFESAVFINPVYADAKYFLGLTYARTNRTQDAITQFEGVAELNPENKDVAQILKNLKSGKQPFDQGIVTPTQPVNDALNGIEAAGKVSDN